MDALLALHGPLIAVQGGATGADCWDVVRLISETINQVRKSQIDPRVANAVGYLANIMIRAVEQGELEGRLNIDIDAIRANARKLEAPRLVKQWVKNAAEEAKMDMMEEEGKVASDFWRIFQDQMKAAGR